MALPTKDEYLKASRKLATGFGSTVDFTDPNVGRTAQAGGLEDSFDQTPGQVFSVDQLPDPAVAVAYGLPAVVIPEHLILESVEEAEHHIQGKSPEDIANAALRRELGDPVLAMDNKVVSAAESLESFESRRSTGGRVAAAAVEKADQEEDEQDADETGSGLPRDPEGVQKAPGAEQPVKEGDAGTDGKGGNPAAATPTRSRRG